MEYGRVLLSGIHKDASTEEVDRYLTILFDFLHRKEIPINGFIKNENGVYLVAATPIITGLQYLGTAYYDNFDFVAYIRNMKEDCFWAIDYENAKGPTLVRYQR